MYSNSLAAMLLFRREYVKGKDGKKGMKLEKVLDEIMEVSESMIDEQYKKFTATKELDNCVYLKTAD